MAPEGVTMVTTSLGVVLGAGHATYNSAIERLEAATVEIMTRKPQSIIQAGVPMRRAIVPS